MNEVQIAGTWTGSWPSRSVIKISLVISIIIIAITFILVMASSATKPVNAIPFCLFYCFVVTSHFWHCICIYKCILCITHIYIYITDSSTSVVPKQHEVCRTWMKGEKVVNSDKNWFLCLFLPCLFRDTGFAFCVFEENESYRQAK